MYIATYIIIEVPKICLPNRSKSKIYELDTVFFACISLVRCGIYTPFLSARLRLRHRPAQSSHQIFDANAATSNYPPPYH